MFTCLFEMAKAVLRSMVALANIPSRYWLPTTPATIQYLSNAKLKTTDGSDKTITEAVELSSLKPELDTKDVKLCAVVHQKLGVEKFRKFFKGDIYFDEERVFYGPKERWMPYSGVLRLNTFRNMLRVFTKSIPGNLAGEGRLLGGVFVIGPQDQGVVYEHQEMDLGDIVKVEDVQAAVQKIAKKL